MVVRLVRVVEHKHGSLHALCLPHHRLAFVGQHKAADGLLGPCSSLLGSYCCMLTSHLYYFRVNPVGCPSAALGSFGCAAGIGCCMLSLPYGFTFICATGLW